MPFPNFEYCIICDGIRPEMAGKLTVLGFFGLAPNVDIIFGDARQPFTISVLTAFPPVPEPNRPYHYVVTVSKPDGTVAFHSPQIQLRVVPNGRGIVGTQVVLAPPHVRGRYTVRMMVNNELKLENSFTIRPPSPEEMARLGIAMPGPQGQAN